MTPRPPRRAVAATILAMLLSACDGPTPAAEPGPAAASPRASPEAAPTPEPSPALPTGPRETPTGDCVRGFSEPQPGESLYAEAVSLLAEALGVASADISVVDLRYFEGPESPPNTREYLLNVRRWYVKAELGEGEAGRFLVEQRDFGGAVVAVAPFDTEGYRSPDWVGFQYEGPDAEPQAYPGLPGEWAGTPYDFVTGEGAFDFPGLPTEVVGCLEGV